MRNATGAMPPGAGRALVGCAGWSLPRDDQPRFPGAGSHLERYAARFPAVEINSSFHRPHRPSTYARWAASVPEDFRFSVKVPKTVTHALKLRGAEDALAAFLAEAGALEARLGCLLVQLPPKLEYDAGVAEAFFAALRERYDGAVACEPRHPGWFTDEADALLTRMRVARVAADPAPVPEAALPGGWREMTYHRLHGSPRTYYSAYDDAFLDALALRLAADTAAGAPAWCIFDNTASGAATPNALGLLERLGSNGARSG